jgi:hypothetical protein
MRDRLDETEDYPRMFVCDGRVSGSITLGRTRLPLWAINAELVHNGWESAAREYYPAADDPAREYYPTEQETSDFLYHLLEQRGEFGRLLCVLADEDRRDLARRQGHDRWWMQMPRRRARVRAALQVCIDEIDAQEHSDGR